MLIFIKYLIGERIQLEIQQSDTILSLKEKIHSLKGCPPIEQRLYLQGKILENNKYMADCRIVENCIITLLISKILPKPNPSMLVDPDKPFFHLLEDPFFLLLLKMIQNTPSSFNQILAQLERDHPNLYKRIYRNREAFLNLKLPSKPPAVNPALTIISNQVIQLYTPSDLEAIQQLTDYGFDINDVVKAYLGNNKNQELALNYLLEFPPSENPNNYYC